MTVSIAILNDEESLYLKNFFGSIDDKWKERLDFIFVDNCSGDDSTEVARRHGIEKIVTFKSKQDSMAALYNAALNKAEGDHILFVHSDIIFGNGFFDRLWRRLVSDPPDVMNFQVYYVDKTTKAGNAIFWKADRQEIYKMQLWGEIPSGGYHRIVTCSDCCFLVRAELAIKDTFNETYGNDLFIQEFMLRQKKETSRVFHESRASVEHYFVERHKQNRTKRRDEDIFIRNNLSVLFSPEIERILQDRDSRISNLEDELRESRSHYEQLSLTMQEIRDTLPAMEKLLKRAYSEAVTAEMLIEAGEICYRFKSYDDARRFFEKAVRLDPANADAYNNLGVLEISKGDLESAKSYFEDALRVSPDCAEAKMNIALLSQSSDVLNTSDAACGKDVI